MPHIAPQCFFVIGIHFKLRTGIAPLKFSICFLFWNRFWDRELKKESTFGRFTRTRDASSCKAHRGHDAHAHDAYANGISADDNAARSATIDASCKNSWQSTKANTHISVDELFISCDNDYDAPSI